MRGSPEEPGRAGDAFVFLGSRMQLLAEGRMTGGQLGLIVQEAPPGFAAPPHVHRGEDEAFYVVSGDATFHVGGESVPAPAGAFVWLPRDVPHWFEVGPGGAKVLQLNLPSRLERFFVELGSPVEAPAGPPDFDRLAEAAARYGIEMLPPA